MRVDFSAGNALVKAFKGTVPDPSPPIWIPRFQSIIPIPSNRRERVYAMKTAVADKLKEVAEKYPGFTYTLLVIGSSIAYTPRPLDMTDIHPSIQAALQSFLSWSLPCLIWI